MKRRGRHYIEGAVRSGCLFCFLFIICGKRQKRKMWEKLVYHCCSELLEVIEDINSFLFRNPLRGSFHNSISNLTYRHFTGSSEHLCYQRRLIDWLFTVLRPAQEFFTYIYHCRWRAAKFRPKLGSEGLWAMRDLYRTTPAVTRDLGFLGLIRRTAPFSRLLRHTRGCGGSILTRILTGLQSRNGPIKGFLLN
jgi:hypothetical protein